ncbi:MAG: hypothetical protein K0R00_2799 [Herbinix sp.]|nr:hypothetical protein [Herbinix sp.]
MSFKEINNEKDFGEGFDFYNGMLDYSDDDIEDILNLVNSVEEDNTEEDNTEEVNTEEDNIKNDNIKDNEEKATKNETTNTIINNTINRSIYSKSNLDKIRNDEMKKNEEKKENNPGQQNQTDVNKIVSSIQNIGIKESEFYEINFLNLDRCMNELSTSKKNEWFDFLKGKYDSKEADAYFWMTTFVTLVEFKKKKEPTKFLENAIDLTFIKEVDAFYKKENFILTPINSREDLVNGKMYIYPYYNKMFIYEDDEINKKFGYIKKETFYKFVATELAKYCYNNEGRLTLHPKGYTPKYILNENVLFIQKYIGDTDKRRELYKL